MKTYFNNLSHEDPLIRAIHTAVKGRARYKISGLHHSQACKRYLEVRLSQEEIVRRFHANPLTGNVLVISHPDFTANAIALLLQNIVLDYTKEVKKLTVNTTNLSIEKEKPQKLAQAPVQKQLNLVNNQLIPVAWVVSTCAWGSLLLHRYGLDIAILLAIQKLHTPLLDSMMLGITFLGEPLALVSICLWVEIVLLYQRRPETTKLAIATASAVGLNYLLKLLFGRARPALWDRLINVGFHSFPSGHAMVSMVIYGFIGYILVKEFPQWEKQISALTIALILAIGFSRLYLGVHWPTDVLAGYAIGLVWLIICILYLELKPKYRLSGGNFFSDLN
ncbi:phosphoesterase [Nostoc sp. NIES-4103]|nr:phosphoesterase [Nostoc sp. NIES-4103]